MIAILLKGDTYAPEIKIHFKFKYLFITLFCLFIGVNLTFAQEKTVNKSITITGTVVSAIDGQILQRATVKIKGTNQTNITNGKGEFSLTTDEIKGTLEISFLGYIKQEIVFNNSGQPVLITLEKADQELQEVEISTGYQNFKPEQFVGSASKLDSTAFSNQAGKQIIERLKGAVTGVMFNRGSNTSPVIRGISTFYTNAMTPLIVVDNFPMDDRFDLNSINPNDVLDISVLKDAAAASIWGSRAGNGVIVITTKKGKYNQKLDISFNSNIGITEKPDLYAYQRIDIPDFIEIERFLFDKGYYISALNNSTTRPVVSPAVEIFNQLKTNKIYATTAIARIEALKKNDIRKDLNQYVYQNAIQQQHYLALKGGSENTNYSLSFGYNPTRSNIQNSKGNKDYTLKGSHNFKPSKNLEINSNLYFTKSLNPNTALGYLSSIPYEALADENGFALPISWVYRVGYLDTVGAGKLLDWQYRPLDEIKLKDNLSNTKSLNVNLGLNYRFIEGLTGSIKYNYRTQNEFRKEHTGPDSYYTRDLINRFSSISGNTVTTVTRQIPLPGILRLYDFEVQSQQVRGQLDFNKTWNSQHRLSALLVGEASESVNNSHSNTFYGYDDEYETYASGLNYETAYPIFARIAGTKAKIPVEESIKSGRISRLVSFLANASYSYKNLYTVYSSARKDGANVFGVKTNNKWKPLWSIGANWNISNEEFFSSPWINTLKLKSSFGYMGNTIPISGLSTINYSPNPAEYTNLIYAVIGTPPNPTLRWEEIKTINVGVDYGLFNNRLSGSFDIFNKESIDLIANRLTDPTSGINKFQMNAASLNTKGTEMKLNSQNMVGKISWTTGFGISYVNTIVTKFYDNRYTASEFINSGTNPSEGKIAQGLSSYTWAGLDPENGDPRGYLNGEISKDYRAIANDSIQNQIFHGSSRPLFFGYLTNSVSWKNLTLSVNCSYQFDYYFRNPTIDYFSLYGASHVGHADYYDRWQNPGDENRTTVPSMKFPADGDRDSFYANSEVNVHRADHIRLNDVRIQWSIPKNTIQKLPIKSLQVFVYANNLNIILWRANTLGLDPELTYPSDYFAYPSPQIWTMGLNITF